MVKKDIRDSMFPSQYGIQTVLIRLDSFEGT